MKINELQARQGKVELQAKIAEKSQIREFQKFGTPGRVCNAKLKDDSGEIALTLWNEQIDQVNVGDLVKITNGYVNEWQGELQLTTGKFGSMEILSKGNGSSESSSTPKKSSAKPKPVLEKEIDDIRPDEEEIEDE